MKYIKEFIIDKSNLAAIASSKQYRIIGEIGAEFDMQVFNSSQQFYNFKTNTFSAGFITDKNLKIKMNSNTFVSNINFPASVSGDTYTILITTSAYNGTELNFGYGKNSYSTTISQLGNTTLTISPATTSHAASYQTFSSTGAANVTSTANPTSTSVIIKDIDWDVKNTDSDAQGYGLRLIRQPVDSDWYFEKDLAIVTNPAGDGVSNSTVTVASLTNIVEGMTLVYHKGTTAPSSDTTITNINTSTKTISFSSNVAFENGETMKLRAFGSSDISSAIGGSVDFSAWNSSTTSATSATLTKTVRGTVSGSTTVTLNGTRGISGGGFVTVSGNNWENSSTNTVQTNRTDASTATASAEAGEIIVQVAQISKEGIVLTFEGSTNTITLSNNIIINSHPSSNQTVYLNLDNFITPGVQTTS